MSLLTQLTDPMQAQAGVVVNENFQALEHQAVYSMRAAATGGLTWGYYGGRWGGFAVAAGTLSLAASATNYIVVDKNDGLISADTDDSKWNDTGSFARVYKVTPGAASIDVAGIEDHRAGPAGVHGGGSMSTNTGASIKQAVRGRTTTGLAGTYSNGAAGVGATFTYINNTPINNLSSAFDGITDWAVWDRVLVAEQADAAQNGIYEVTSMGSNPFVLTRASDADTAGKLGNAEVTVAEGALWAGKRQIQPLATSAITLGTTALEWRTPQGLVHALEALITTGQSFTYNVVSYMVQGGGTHTFLALVPKGNAGIMAAVPDGTEAGGNTRGLWSVDFQLSRTNADQVAANPYGGLFAGRNNRIAAGGSPGSIGCVILGGANNAMTGNQSSYNAIAGCYQVVFGNGSRMFAGGSEGCTVQGTYLALLAASSITSSSSVNSSVISGRSHVIPGNSDYNALFGFTNSMVGHYNLISGSNHVVAADHGGVFGNQHTIDASGVLASGQNATPRGLYGSRVMASGRRTATGDAQMREGVLMRQTTDATPAALTASGGAPVANNQFKFPAGASVFKIRGQATAINRAAGDVAGWDFSALCKRVAGGTVSLVGAPVVTQVGADAGAASWALQIASDDTNKVVQIIATGAAGATIDWRVHVFSVEAA